MPKDNNLKTSKTQTVMVKADWIDSVAYYRYLAKRIKQSLKKK